jgi:hypothetical protein
MPRYYIDTEIDSELAHDEEGVILRDNLHAHNTGISTLHDLAIAAVPDRPYIVLSAFIRDEANKSLCSVRITIETEWEPEQ